MKINQKVSLWNNGHIKVQLLCLNTFIQKGGGEDDEEDEEEEERIMVQRTWDQVAKDLSSGPNSSIYLLCKFKWANPLSEASVSRLSPFQNSCRWGCLGNRMDFPQRELFLSSYSGKHDCPPDLPKMISASGFRLFHIPGKRGIWSRQVSLPQILCSKYGRPLS